MVDSDKQQNIQAELPAHCISRHRPDRESLP